MKTRGVSEWKYLMAFLGTADSKVHIVHISLVIIAYTLESLSSLTQITHNLQTQTCSLTHDIMVDSPYNTTSPFHPTCRPINHSHQHQSHVDYGGGGGGGGTQTCSLTHDIMVDSPYNTTSPFHPTCRPINHSHQHQSHVDYGGDTNLFIDSWHNGRLPLQYNQSIPSHLQAHKPLLPAPVACWTWGHKLVHWLMT